MSNIWHTADEKPMLHRDIILCGDGWSMPMDIIPETVNNIRWKNVEKWCYVDDLIKENENTRKALDVAVNALDTVRQYYRGTAVIRPHNIAAYCDNKIDQINETKGDKYD